MHLVHILTPLIKFRSARDNIDIATGAMEVRGGNGYIEDCVNARLVRDAHLGELWEGTSNITARDINTRAVAKVGAHSDLKGDLQEWLDGTAELPRQSRGELSSPVDRAYGFAEDVGSTGNEPLCRQLRKRFTM